VEASAAGASAAAGPVAVGDILAFLALMQP